MKAYFTVIKKMFMFYNVPPQKTSSSVMKWTTRPSQMEPFIKAEYWYGFKISEEKEEWIDSIRLSDDYDFIVF